MSFINNKMYTKNDFKIEIKKVINDNGYDAEIIAKETYKIYVEHVREIDRELREKLLDIATMEMGPEFEMTEKEFMDFLDKM